MFKLESYITPILLDYVAKYVKNIREEDFQLSLWEGEVALHNLDLRLDVLQEELNLPLEFISGHIHDLSIRVPWTKITSEPITIVINTIEFVLKLKNPHEDGAGSSASSSPQRLSDSKKKRKCPPKGDDRPPNPEASSSWLISKIINNISLQCHNIIFKYVEEDIVVSMNVQLLSFGSANDKWESAMIDVHPVKVLIRKLVKISDLTICLDNRNAAGQIDVCQEPILYRSSLECRMLLKYNANSPDSNRITRIGVFTSLLDMNISSLQIPLCLRLALAFSKHGNGNGGNKPIKPITLENNVEDCVEEEHQEHVDQSYLAWVWNKLPSLNFAPGYEDEPTNDVPCHTIDFGFYAEQLSFTLKNAEFVHDTHMATTKRIRYSPIVRFTIGGMYLEFVSAEARDWTSAKAGVSKMLIEPLGPFKSDDGNLLQSEQPSNQRTFMDKSLFDENCLIADKGWGVTNYEEYTARITDDYLLYRSPVLAVDFIKYKVGENGNGPSMAKPKVVLLNGNRLDDDISSNRLQYRFLTAGLTFRYTQTLEQVKQLISEFINSYDYPAYYTETLDGGSIQTGGNGSKLPPPLMEDYDALMQHIPMRTYKFSLKSLTLEFYAKTEMDAAAAATQKMRAQSAQQPAQSAQPPPQSSRSTTGLSGNLKSAGSSISIQPPPHFLVYISEAEGSMNTPLQPEKLVHTTCQLPEKPLQLLDACYENYNFHINEFSCSLVPPSSHHHHEKRSRSRSRSRIVHIPNFTANYRKLLYPQLWKDDQLKVQQLNLSCEQISLNFTRRELNTSFYLAQSVRRYNPVGLQRLLILESADFTDEDLTSLKNNFIHSQLNWNVSANQNIWCFTLNGFESAIVRHKRRNGKQVEENKVFSSTAMKGSLDNLRWLEVNLIPAIETSAKERLSKTIVVLWLAPFAVDLDGYVLNLLSWKNFNEMETETTTENILNTQILSVPSFQSNASVQSSAFMTAIQAPAPAPAPTLQPSIARRSSRSSLQRRISHPEETIHVSSERDERIEKDTSISASPRQPEDPRSKLMPSWLSFIKSYTLLIDIDSGKVRVAENFQTDSVFTTFILPRIQLKPSNFESSKTVNFAQLQSIAAMSCKEEKTNNNVNWILSFSEMGIVSEIDTKNEVLLQPFQTTITLALLQNNEKIKNNLPDGKRDDEAEPTTVTVQVDNKTMQVQKEPPIAAEKVKSLTHRNAEGNAAASISPGSDCMSSGSPTVGGGRSEKSMADNVTTDILMEKTTKTFAKNSPKRPLKNMDVYTLNLHADTTPLRFCISSRKIRTFESHLSILSKALQRLSLTQQQNQCCVNPSEQISIPTATEENAFLKEFLELETNSEASKNSDEKNDAAFVILLFCQWTITRITCEIEANPSNYRSSKVILDFEDLLSTIDKREDYTKCTSKIGNLNCTYFEENLNGEWASTDGFSIRLLGETNNLPFLNIIFTSVGLKQFFKRIGAKTTASERNRSLKEIIIKMQAMEIILNLERISQFVAAVVSGFYDRCNEQQNNVVHEANEATGGGNAAIKAAHNLPMIHFDSKGLTLYLPLDKGKELASAAIFQIQKITVTPNLENPLQRKPLRSDIFAKAAQLGMLVTPGSIIEDRQYELTLENISAASGNWHQISRHISEQRDNFHRTNPAFEWNNQNRKQDLQITEIFNKFKFIAIYAPAIVYQNVLISGQAIEFNCATDFVASLNTHQLNMISSLIVHLQHISCFLKGPRKKQKHVVVALVPKYNRKSSTSVHLFRNNNGNGNGNRPITSTLRERCNSFTLNNLRECTTGRTYGKNFNSIDEDNEHSSNFPTSDSGFQSCISSNPVSSSQRLKYDRYGSISTISSLPPQAQTRNIPQTVSLVAGVFLLKFYDIQIKENHQDNDHNNKNFEHNKRIINRPLFSITLSQPSFMYTQGVYDFKTQISIYDFYIYVSTSRQQQKNLSGGGGVDVDDFNDASSFNEIIVDTRPGEANAAGIIPPLLTYRKHCTKMKLCECEIEIAKPIAIQLTEEKVKLLCQYMLLINGILLENPCYEVRSTRSVVRGSKIHLMRQQCFDADRLHIFIRSIVVRFSQQSSNDTSYNCKLVASDFNFNMKYLNRPEKATTKASMGALYLLVDQKVVLHPLSLRLSVDFVSEQWYELPLITANLKINMLQLDVGISSVLHLQEALEGYDRMMEDLLGQWQAYLLKRPFENEVSPKNNTNLEMVKCPSACELLRSKSSSSRSSLQKREEFYQDDLRAGAFQFVEMNTDTFLPMPYQIQIIKKNFGIICWRYPQPRRMNKIHVYPVPMAMPNPIHIRCRMEYYSDVHENFLQYCDFSLSETVSKEIKLPERQICANIWRVVILQSLISVNGACFDDLISENEFESQKSIASIKIDDVFNTERKESDFIVHPKVLVGCMRIDTTFESSCVPKIQLLLSCNFLTIKVMNQPNQGDELPKLLRIYKLVQTTNISQTFLSINFHNLSVHSALVSSGNYLIESNTSCSIKCLDYGFLNMLPILDEAFIKSYVTVNTTTTDPSTLKETDVSVNLVLDRLRFNLGPKIMHSLLASKSHWEEYLKRDNTTPRHALVPRCIIINRTYMLLAFGQTGTTERIQLQIRGACMYSFRSDFHSQELTFFITDAETQMTEASPPVPISLKFNGESLVHPVRVGIKCIFIKCCKLSPMQICVFIKGQIELMSMVPHEMRLDFRSENNFEAKKSSEYLIDKRECSTFYYAVYDQSNISMRLKFADNSISTKTRSGDIPLRSNKNLPWLVKVPHEKYEFISFWVRVFREDIHELTTDNFKPQKILITIWPIFEICSMMPIPIEAEEKTTLSVLDLLPEGEYKALDVPATHLTDHLIKFNFKHQNTGQKSSIDDDEYNLTLKQLEWKEFFYYDEDAWKVEDVLTELSKDNSVMWPCDDEDEQRIQRRPAAMPPAYIPAILYNCMPSRELSCTLRLEVSPWGYLINSTSMPVLLRQGQDANNFVLANSNGMEMLFAIEKFFTLEVSYSTTTTTNWVASSPIYFEETARFTPSGSQFYVLSEASPVDVVILRGGEIIKFVLSFKFEGQRRILMLRSKFVVTNFSKQSICVLPFAMDHKESAKREQVEILDNRIEKNSVQPVVSRDAAIGISLDCFNDLWFMQQKAKRTIDTAFVCFACIKIGASSSDISIPIPLSMPFTRRCFSAQNGRDSVAFATNLIERNGIHYLNIFDDTAPALLINNQTDMKFIVGQTSASENSKVSSTTPEYTGRHFEWYQLLKACSKCYYTPPEMYTSFPDVESALCNLTLALYKEKCSKKDIKWSKPLRTDKSWERFLHIPNHGDVKIIICDKHRIKRVSIYYILQQKEFSIKDLRSRLSTKFPAAIEVSEENVESLITQSNSPTTSKRNSLETCIHHRQIQRIGGLPSRKRFRMHIYAKELVFRLHAETKGEEFSRSEVLSIYIDDFLLAYDDSHNSKLDLDPPDARSMNLILQNLQIDNQLHSSGKFDFPVIICAQELYQHTLVMPQADCLENTYKDLLLRTPMVVINLKLYDDELSISDIRCSMSPLRAYIEDAYLNELFDALVECVPSNCVLIMNHHHQSTINERIELAAGQSLLPCEITAQAICFAEPLQLRSLRIEPLEVLLSVHTSVRLYIALDHSPLSFSSYQRQQILTMPLRFGQSVGMHYLSGAIFGAGWVVGSLEILGSPSGLARSFTTGLRDFVAMPVQGLFRGPWGFIVGITQGSASLLKNVTAGTVNSLTKLAASVARNLDRLSLDQEHIDRTEALRRVRPNSLTEGFSQGLTGLGISMLGAVGGIAHHTLEARSPAQVVAGVGKGIVGAFTKPISGAAELVALTGQGVLQTVGFNALPTQRLSNELCNPVKEPSAYRIWKLLPSVLSTDQVLFYHEITLVVQNQMRSAYVFLTSTVFAILIAQWDKLEFAYPVNKITITRDRDDKTLFLLHLVRENADEEDNISYTNERIMSFLQSSYSIRESAHFSMGSLSELLQHGTNTEQRSITSRNLDWAFYINEYLGEHLMHYLKILRSKI